METTEQFAIALQQYRAGQFAQARSTCQHLVQQQPNHAQALNLLGIIACQAGNLAEGIAAYQRALAVQPAAADVRQNLARALQLLGQIEAAIAQLQQVLQYHPELVAVHRTLATLLHTQGKLDEAASHYHTVLTLQPSVDVHYSLGKTLEEQGRTEAAIAQFQQVRKLKPDLIEAVWQQALILPVLYDTPEQLRPIRQRFCRQLNHLGYTVDLASPEGRAAALRGLDSRTNFYLAYQGFNDRGLQSKYGHLVHRIMAANYPDWVQPLALPPLPSDSPEAGKIRVGYVSAYLMAHSAAAWARGWIKAHDRQTFEIYSYHLGQRTDFITEEFRRSSDQFRHLPGPLEPICQQILADRLHILVFTDLGMDPQTTQLAGLRLAPVQCTAWGHPVTSGIPTIDYYLSSELMEPEQAQQHYSEQLVLLPNIGICYAKPPQPEQNRSRSDFGLRPEAVVYLSFQSPYKYLPQYDRIFAQIAQQVPQAQFVFLRHSSTYVVERFQQRLQRAFAAYGLESQDYCRFLPKLDRGLYWNLNQVAHVFLDTFAWSGGNSTLEAVAYGLPVVTCPGNWMRGRHSYAILQRLGVTETIAATEADYVAIAVRLGQDGEWRRAISEKIQAGHALLYDDTTCVRALEAFYRRAVSQYSISGVKR